jgi:LPS sulfotransferase NodH
MTTAEPPPKPEWSPHIWEGCDFFAWLRLLARNRFAVSPSLWYVAVIVTFVSLMHTLLRLLQDAIYGRRIQRIQLAPPPLFILGHWRTGTTWLHELLIQDERHGYPTTYECMDPNDFLLTEGLFTRWLWFLAPNRRPMDNMRAGFDRPQEDEFALCLLGQGSPYKTISFPNRPPQDQKYLDLEGLSLRALRSWKQTFRRFLQQVTYRNPGKRLILKSPPHTCRIKVLQQLFPDALFVHIVRDPYVVFPSTVSMWKTMYRLHGLQKPTFAGLEDYVFETGLRLYDKLEATRSLVDPSRFFEVRYEALVKDPVGQIRMLYEHLNLGGFEEMQPRLERSLAENTGYKTNRYQLLPEQRAQIRRRWGRILQRYGYGEEGG